MNRRLRLRGLAATLLFSLLGSGLLAAPVPLDRIVAVVNEGVITSTELETRVSGILEQLTIRGTAPPPREILEAQVLERLVTELVQVQYAKQAGIRISDIDLNASLRDIAKRNNMDLLQLRETLINQGRDFETFRENIRKEMLIARVHERMVTSRTTVSEREIDNHLAREATLGNTNTAYRMGHILIAVPEGSTPNTLLAAKAKAQQLRDSILEGADFAQVAVAESDGQQALAGGDLGWRKAAEVPTLFAPILAVMEPGEISEPVRSPSGYHLVKLIERRSEAPTVVQQTLARQILIRPNAVLTNNLARDRIERLRDRIVGGDSFAELARANSDDSISASRGGELEWLNPGSAPQPIERAMARLAIGEVSEPLQTQFGWHLIQVLDRREQDLTELVQRNRARSALLKRKSEEETERWIRQLREEAYLEIHLNEE